MIFINTQMASWKGFEPLTDGLEGRCSILLSYRVKPKYHYIIFSKKEQKK